MKDFDVKKIVGEVAARHGVLIDTNDPLMVALTANGLVLEVLAKELLIEVQTVALKLESVSVALPIEARVALAQAATDSADAARRGMASDIEGAGLKARAIVDAVYRAQSRVRMWTWIAVGMVLAILLFAAGFIAGRWLGL